MWQRLPRPVMKVSRLNSGESRDPNATTGLYFRSGTTVWAQTWTTQGFYISDVYRAMLRQAAAS
jgi:hypothetical protein